MNPEHADLMATRIVQGCTVALVTFALCCGLVVATLVHFAVKFW